MAMSGKAQSKRKSISPITKEPRSKEEVTRFPFPIPNTKSENSKESNKEDGFSKKSLIT